MFSDIEKVEDDGDFFVEHIDLEEQEDAALDGWLHKKNIENYNFLKFSKLWKMLILQFNKN